MFNDDPTLAKGALGSSQLRTPVGPLCFHAIDSRACNAFSRCLERTVRHEVRSPLLQRIIQSSQEIALIYSAVRGDLSPRWTQLPRGADPSGC